MSFPGPEVRYSWVPTTVCPLFGAPPLRYVPSPMFPLSDAPLSSVPRLRCAPSPVRPLSSVPPPVRPLSSVPPLRRPPLQCTPSPMCPLSGVRPLYQGRPSEAPSEDVEEGRLGQVLHFGRDTSPFTTNTPIRGSSSGAATGNGKRSAIFSGKPLFQG